MPVKQYLSKYKLKPILRSTILEQYYELLARTATKESPANNDSISDRLEFAIYLAYGMDPKKLEQTILEMYKTGQLPVPKGIPLNYDFEDLLRGELRGCDLYQLRGKWYLTTHQLASILFWYVIRCCG